jgi:predicted dienelactone hydrolase
MHRSLPGFALLLVTTFAQVPEIPRLDLLHPDGRYRVGTRTAVFKDVQRKRDLLVTTWYPAAFADQSLAPYMDPKTAAAIAADWELPSDFVVHIRTNAFASAPVASAPPFPVVLLEHGSGMVPAAYTVLAEGLAGAGFIVVATNHPPDSLIAAYPDGRELRFTPYWPEKADRRAQGIAIGKFADEVLVADVRFVIDQLQDLNAHDPFWRGHLDMKKIGIVGHSMGGTTAALATLEEPRITAGANLDGSTYPGMNNDVRPIEIRKPFLFLATPEHASDPATQVREFVGTKSNTYYVVIPGTDHLSFTDKRLIASRLASTASPEAYSAALRSLELTRSLLEEFFGKYLQGSAAPHLERYHAPATTKVPTSSP